MTALSGYRQLEKRDFALSRAAAFGLFGHQKIVLRRRPVKRLFMLAKSGMRYLDISFITDASETARGAVDVTIDYFGPIGGRLAPPLHHQLFADPIGAALPQRLWLDPPKGARFANVSFRRARPGREIALDGRIKLTRSRQAINLGDYGAVLQSRDLSAMALLLPQLEATCDRVRAEKLLVRMRWLSDARPIARKLASLKDGDSIIANGPGFTVPGAQGYPATAGISHIYDQLLTESEHAPLPLAKALRREALSLFALLKADSVEAIDVAEGADWLARLIVVAALKQSMPALKVQIDWPRFEDVPLGLGHWHAFTSGNAFLATPGGAKVRALVCGQTR